MNPIIRLLATALLAIPLAANAAGADRGHTTTVATATTVKPAEVVVPPHRPHTCIGWRRFCRNR